LDQWTSAEEVHPMFGADEGPECDNLWPLLLLDMHW